MYSIENVYFPPLQMWQMKSVLSFIHCFMMDCLYCGMHLWCIQRWHLSHATQSYFSFKRNLMQQMQHSHSGFLVGAFFAFCSCCFSSRRFFLSSFSSVLFLFLSAASCFSLMISSLVRSLWPVIFLYYSSFFKKNIVFPINCWSNLI